MSEQDHLNHRSHSDAASQKETHNAMGGHDMSAMLKNNEKALKITSWLTGVYFVIELGLGLYSGSIAVISDALHTFSAVGGVLLALVAGRIAARPADKYHTYGSMRAEIIGALLNGLFLFVMALFVVYIGVQRLLNPVDLPTGIMLLAAAGGLITELISIKLLFSSQKDNLNMRGAFWHVMQTFIGSLIIIVAAAVIYFTGFLEIDPILGIAFGLTLIWASWGITRDALKILMETVPQDVDIDAVKESLADIDGINNVHHIHAWALTSGRNLFSAHIQIADAVDHETVLEKANGILKTKFGFYFSTLQVERKCHDAGEASDIDFADTPS